MKKIIFTLVAILFSTLAFSHGPTPQKVQESVEEQVKQVPTIVEEQEVIVSKNEKAETQALIADLEELLEFSEESEKVATQSLIDDLKELLEFMD